ncbi:sigma-70 family RNA polymerase sigma factor [Ktedonobacteria bacterium brp13]|nr:sigma-70 family RNA polymerase sigma factor [Ktedonobacteria bacterium brp13]
MHQPHNSSLNEGIDFDLFYQKHALTVLRYLNARLTLKEDAEDLMIEVFQASFQNLTVQKLGFTEQQAWLLRVARNKLADHYRLQQQRTSSASIDAVADVLMVDDIAHQPELFILRKENHSSLMAHIGTLDALQQEVLRLRFAYGLHSGEIATRLNKKAPAIRAILSRTLNKLRLRYKKQEEQD